MQGPWWPVLASAEAAGEGACATQESRSVGRFGVMGGFSFNGNKIITTSGGGMLVSAEEALVQRAGSWPSRRGILPLTTSTRCWATTTA